MRIIDINGRLATAGSWDETSQSEADAQARLRATRTDLRAMLEGNVAFHVDPMAAPAEPAKPDYASCWIPQSVTGVGPIGFKRGSEAEVWHTEAPTVVGLYITTWHGNPPTTRHWDGVSWSQSHDCARVGGERQSDFDKRKSSTKWFRLVEADTPAPAVQ